MELLIVIVVIGILAAVTIATFNGVSIRAQGTKHTSSYQAWVKTLLAYYEINGEFPDTTTTNLNICLGENYPAEYGFSTDVCQYGTSEGIASRTTDQTLMNTIRNSVGSIPSDGRVASTEINYGGRAGTQYYRGLIYRRVMPRVIEIKFYQSNRIFCPSDTVATQTTADVVYCYKLINRNS